MKALEAVRHYRRAIVITLAVLVLLLACGALARCVAVASTDNTHTCALAKPGGGGAGGARGGGARSGGKPAKAPKAPPGHPNPKPVVIVDGDCD